ncbi:MAG: ABC transporter ATP-binding protein [Lachnospiraceae bacterium]|nr:ABC transporter ATP-binding protein/permease [Clostridiales bacterium]MDD6293546.1 ABC transporter ATP-binding protein [Eubacteriales bacterium]MDY2607679.1 ABC transporter ATP-binding protein [Lachnospiraceae bacterium]
MAEQRRRRGPGGGGFGAPAEKTKDFKGTIKKLMSFAKTYTLQIAMVMVFAIGSTIFTIAGPKILGKATTELGKGLGRMIAGTGGINFHRIGVILGILLGMYAVSALFSFIQGWLMTGVSQKMCYNLRDAISKKLNRLPISYYESRNVGEILSRITNDVDTLQMSLNQCITQLITSVTTVIGILIMMLSISPIMTLIAIVILPLSGMMVGLVVKKSQKYFVAQQKYLGKINGQIEEVYSGQNIVKAFNREDIVLDEFDKTNEVLYKSAWKSQFLSGMMQPIMSFISNLGYVAVAVVGGFLVINHTIEIGDIQSFIQYVRSFTQPIAQLAQVSNMFQSMVAAAERVFELLDEPEEELYVENPVKLDNVEGNVTFDHVSFGYKPDKIIIHDFSCEVKPGQTVAIVGPTGAGKTTMVKLLMRFYDANTGSIKVDGHDIKDFNRYDLRDNFGMVLQDTWLFKGTIMENIRYGRLDATDEEVIAAAKAAHAHHFIKTLPDGYQMELNEDASNVSQGQKQLLTIARAILADKKILILDEATSSVDTRTEVRIQKAMDNLMRGRTSFVIAHRLSTIKDADMILVMKDGDIIEQGNHEELIAKNGFYANLYNSQFEDIA